MTKFVLNQPVPTPEPVTKVDPLPRPGKYTFQLVVVDDRGLQSRPVQVVVVVVKQ